MEVREKEKLLEQSNILRKELKAWEKEVEAKNGGRKASRDDIKENRAIAEKYKQYNRARDILSGKINLNAPAAAAAPEESHRRTSRKRKHEDAKTQTPSKRQHATRTPSKSTSHPADLDPYDSPSLIRTLFTPSKVTALGPTPQKDGQVLGLFDLLPPSGDDATPTKDSTSPQKHNISSRGIQATPSKPRNSDVLTSPNTNQTPTTSRFKPNSNKTSFTTPLKHRSPNQRLPGNNHQTPTSFSKLSFSTPAFLRRHNSTTRRFTLPSINESDGSLNLDVSPELVRLPIRRPLVRGLSSMLAGLRKLGEEAADEDLEALHEAENSSSNPIREPSVPGKETAVQVQVEDSQMQGQILSRPTLLSGFDDEAMYDSPPEEGDARMGRPDGQPSKPWKKRGQKRTTRRVVMKPVRSKPASSRSHAQVDYGQEVADEEVLDGMEYRVEDTQQLGLRDQDLASATTFPAEDDGSDYAASDDDEDEDADPLPMSTKPATTAEVTTKNQKPQTITKNAAPAKSGNKLATTAKKVSAMAHQNFKRLKLRNSGAKGGPGYGSRFRRRR